MASYQNNNPEINNLLALTAFKQAPEAGQVRILKVGTIYDEAGEINTPTLPRAVYTTAKNCGITLKVSTLSASDFLNIYPTLVDTEHAPEILIFRNSNNLMPGNLAHKPNFWSQYQHVGGLLYDMAGFTFFDTQAVEYRLAVKLVMALPPLMSEKGKTKANKKKAQSSVTPNETFAAKPEIANLILQASKAYMERDMATLQDLADPKYFQMTVPALRTPKPSTGINAQIVRLFGLDNLIFALVSAKFVSEKLLGEMKVATIWRKDKKSKSLQTGKVTESVRNDEVWQLLAASHDPVTVKDFLDDVEDFIYNLPSKAVPSSHAEIYNFESEDETNYAPKLISPDQQVYAKPAEGERFGEMVWQPTPHPAMVGEILEVAFDTGNRLFFVPLSADRTQPQRISTGKLWGGGCNDWRVWSWDAQGNLLFSLHRTLIQ